MKIFNSNNDLKAGDWFKILSLDPLDFRYYKKESYEGKIFEYKGQGYSLPIDNPIACIFFKKGFTFSQTDL